MDESINEARKLLETFSNSTVPRKQGGRNTPETKGTG